MPCNVLAERRQRSYAVRRTRTLREREDDLVRISAEARFQKKGRKAGFRFFNVGRQGAHRAMLTAEQIETVRARFAPTMARFGY
jgi:hypothetical protein